MRALLVAVSLCACSSSSPAPPSAPADASSEGGGSHAVCSFNRDCPADERCACDVATGCFCEIGARGTGKSGVDACTTGNDCASSVCVEGPGGAYVCSGECATNADCGGSLPVCGDIAFVGRICVRAAP
jgi:hypothetical protein